MVKRYIELSRKYLGEDEAHYWGTFCLDNNNEVNALLAAVWEFGVHKQNYSIKFVLKNEEDEE